MKTTNRGLLQLLAILIAVEIVSGSVSVNVTRLAKGDTFTNPNRTAVRKCHSSGQGSSYQETCKGFYLTDTRALCSSRVQCCELCECETDYPTYLPHLGKCVSLSELNADVFGQGSNGCGPRLEVKAKGGGDDDDDDRDDDDDTPRHKDVCKVTPWNPPVIDFQSSSNPKIKFCAKKDIDYRNFDGVRYSGFIGWKNVTNFTQTFWERKDKKDIVFQWNTAKASHFNGNVIVINFSCKQKKRNSFSACFIFKSAGTQIVIPPKSSTTTTTVTTTRYPVTTTTTTTTTTTKPVTIATTTAKHTTTKLTATMTTQQTTKTTASKPLTTGPVIKPTTTQKEGETTSPHGTKTSYVITTEATEPTEPTESTEPGGAGKLSGNSRDGGGTGATVTIVATVCGVVLAATVVCIISAWHLRKRRARKEISSLGENDAHFEKPTSEQGKLDDHIYEGQNDVYQLLERDGKSAGGGHWEPSAYQGLAKGVTEGTWSEGEVYTNPVVYQDLKKNDTTSKENLPAYQPLLKQHKTTTADTSGYEYGYLVLTGEHGKMENTTEMSEESPYYFKLERHDKVEGTA